MPKEKEPQDYTLRTAYYNAVYRISFRYHTWMRDRAHAKSSRYLKKAINATPDEWSRLWLRRATEVFATAMVAEMKKGSPLKYVTVNFGEHDLHIPQPTSDDDMTHFAELIKKYPSKYIPEDAA